MSKVRVESFTISLDGFGAGPNQAIDNPPGVGGTSLHGWAFSTHTFQKAVFGNEGGSAEGIDEDYAVRGFRNIGAWILGTGERLFDGIDLPALGYACTRHEASPLATHVVFTRQ